jgi:hypothetical protein
MRAIPIHNHPERARRRRAAERVLRDALARVRSGEVDELVILMIAPDGTTTRERTDLRNADVALGALRRAEHEILQTVERSGG